jgi:MraW methylase family
MATATHRIVGSAVPSANLTYVPRDHEPVLAEELIDVLDPRPGETFLDATFGAAATPP